MKYISLGFFSNETDKEITIFLELACEEIKMAPGHEIELLMEELDGVTPVSILYNLKGLQIYPRSGWPAWLIRFKGKEIVPSYPRVLREYE